MRILLIKKLLIALTALLNLYTPKFGAVTIQSAEDSYYQKNGKYFQVQLGDKTYPNTVVNIYQTADGQQGYQIINYYSTSTVGTGYGVLASRYNFFIDKTITPKTASTTQ